MPMFPYRAAAIRPLRRVRVLPAKLACLLSVRYKRGGGQTGCLPSVIGNSEIRRIESVLPLEVVHEGPVYDVNGVDDGLGDKHSLEEIVGSSHFRHELDEQLQTSIRQHAREQAINRSDEVRRGKSCEGHYRRIIAVRVWGDGCFIDRTCSCFSSLIQMDVPR